MKVWKCGVKSNMKQIMIGVLGAVLSGCVPGEATVKISAENVRKVLNGEVVEVPVHGEVEVITPTAEWMKKGTCRMCQAQNLALTNSVIEADRRLSAATRVMTLLMADGSCVAGGVKVVGTNVVHWATIDTKFLFGSEAAILADSNKVARCNGFFALNDKGEIDLKGSGCKDVQPEKLERMSKILETVADGCECCKDAYAEVMMVLGVTSYDSISLVFEGDGRGGFCLEADGKRVVADKIGKEFRCAIRSKDSDKKSDKLIRLQKE